MSYTINDNTTCQPTSKADFLIDGYIAYITFVDGTVKQQNIPFVDFSGDISGKADLVHPHILADITDWDPTVFATSAQGAKADSAIQQATLESYITSQGFLTSLDVQSTNDGLTNHLADYNNPHQVTATQLGLGNVDNTSDVNKPISTLQQTEITNKYNAAISYINSKLSLKVDKVTGSRLITSIEASKLANLDDEHYRAPTASLITLTAMLESSLYDNERRYVASEGKDYFYDANAITGDAAPDDQTNGTGFWITSDGAVAGYTQWLLSTGGTFRKNMTNSTTLDLRATGLLSVAYTAEGIVTYSTTATQNATDASLRDRSTHTGEQPISSVTGLQDELDNKILESTQSAVDAMNTAVTWIPGTLYVIPC